MRKIMLFFILTLFTSGLFAQDPVSWTLKLVDKGNGEIELNATAKIAPTWHLYEINVPDDGPMPTALEIDNLKGANKAGNFKAVNSQLKKSYDELFEMEIGYYENQATFVQSFKVTDKNAFLLEGVLRGQICSEVDGQCIPVKIDFSYKAKDLPATLAAATDVKDSEQATENTTNTTAETAQNTTTSEADQTADQSLTTAEESGLWTPVIQELRQFGAAGDTSNQSFLWIFLGGFGGGLIALLTPCVWPMIPMTVSFFLKRSKKNRAKAIKDAVTYGLGIIIIYVALGLLITGVFGASALNDLSTSALFNLIFFALLVLFAVSFLGAFELVLPSSWTNKMDSKADSTTGIISIFFMAFTLALVSFSCTGPIIGTLLVQAASSGAVIAPAIGMFGFALALAIPFTLFAIFPSW